MMSVELGGKSILFRLAIYVEPDGDEFHAFCPALKGLHTSGRTEEEALEHASNAVIAYLRSLMKHGDPIPVGCLADEEHEKASVARTHARKHVENFAFAATA